MPDVGYAFISAYLKGEESKVITSENLNSMLRASSVQEVLGSIRETDVGTYLEGVNIEEFDELDRNLWLYLSGCLERLEWFKTTPAEIRKILNVYIVKYDVLNIKAALQGISTGKKASLIPAGILYNHGLLDELSDTADIENITKILTECKLESYSSIIKGYDIDETGKPEISHGTELDEEYYKNLMSAIQTVKDGSLLSRAFSTIIDMTNLKIVLRAIIGGMETETAGYTISGGYMTSEAVIRELISLKLTEVPGRFDNTQYKDVVEEVIINYDKSKSITAVEEVIDKHSFRLNREILSPKVLSPAVAIWYLIVKENEIRNLRLIFKSMFDNIPVEEIKDYLVLLS